MAIVKIILYFIWSIGWIIYTNYEIEKKLLNKENEKKQRELSEKHHMWTYNWSLQECINAANQNGGIHKCLNFEAAPLHAF